MDQEQKKKWSEKLNKAEEDSHSINPERKNQTLDINKIKKKYSDLQTDDNDDDIKTEGIIDLTPDPSVEDGVQISVQAFKELNDADDEITPEKKLIITSKSGKIIGFEG